jgi:hypothetical protein
VWGAAGAGRGVARDQDRFDPGGARARNVLVDALADVDVCGRALREAAAHSSASAAPCLAGTRQDPSRSALQCAQVLEVRAPTSIIGGLGDKPGGVVMGVEQLVDDLLQSYRLGDCHGLLLLRVRQR